MPKWGKTIIAILLLPLCAGGGMALARILKQTGDATTFWMPLLGGIGAWLVIYAIIPRPMWFYVFGHELTHALWTWLFGGKLKKFRVTSKGGHVVITKSNFLISLAPYFFPVYAALLVLIYVVGNLIWNWSPWLPWFHFFLGTAYAFHVTFTVHIIQKRQTDIVDEGYFFSAVVIYLGNLLGLLIGIPLLAGSPPLMTVFIWWGEKTLIVLRWIQELAHKIV